MSATVAPEVLATTPILDLMTAADTDEMTAESILAHPRITSEDRDLAEFLSARAAAQRSEIARRLGR